jgi:hypothetical protein
MKFRVLVIAFLVGALGGCSFASNFESYCEETEKCQCTNGACCVLPTFECDLDIGCCGPAVCSGGKCVTP